jgi:hypothetical protein
MSAFSFIERRIPEEDEDVVVSFYTGGRYSQ